MDSITVREKLLLEQRLFLLEADSMERAETLRFIDSITTRYEGYRLRVLDKSWTILFLNSDKKMRVEVWGGNWCSDTQEGIPGLVKVLDEWGFPSDCFEYKRVSRDRLTLNGSEVSQPLGPVPRVRLWRGSMLLGEIIEFPKKSWEEDLCEIVKGP